MSAYAPAEIEIGRLAVMLKYPHQHVERRVEHLDLKDDHHYAVRVVQQIVIPSHARAAAASRRLLVPIGYFSKTLLPDLAVIGPDGEQLPVLNRAERGRLIAILFGAGRQKDFFRDVGDGDRVQAQQIWTLIQNQVAEIANQPSALAAGSVDDLRDFMTSAREDKHVPAAVQSGLEALVLDESFWRELDALAKTRLIVASMPGEPGGTYVVTSEYTERFRYDEHGRSRLLTQIMGWLGWVTIGVHRAVANFGRAHSHWIVQTLPEGVEPVRHSWDDQFDENIDATAALVESDRVVAARYEAQHTPGDSRQLILDVQIAASVPVIGAAGLALMLLFVSSYIYQTPGVVATGSADNSQESLVALAGVLAAVPAGVAGALAYGGQTFVRRMSRGPRVLLALLSVQAVFLSILVSLKRVEGLVAGSAYILSVYSLFVFGIFTYIAFGPRWRKTEDSRWKWRTRPRSPRECRHRQMRWASWSFVGLLLAVVVFARCQDQLRYEHFFTDEFPGNVWDAWWSWFGL